ncbi:hypothetical protein EJ05DRAFT_520820 [Pseudovirgaria hyperparasitica]|uniref:Uncharacterized protein n=1 Tax=Pseudovirgaria hyperparasitica TaxID=470096 RepID=A0A6A6VWQ0_9PEZI|nr:uncharacterized protein EJ05DRAFT_520820 [Pseudovirgaria hyperparasitica]KAF2754070.1 hypothetical protein EJ05DRAFT_520820 [Pseudovirgaria hyperparasitica]
MMILQKLVGDNGFGSVALATTTGNNVPRKTGGFRERDLRSQSDSIEDAGAESALQIVKSRFDSDRKIVTDLQRDMADRRITLNNTAAGMEVADLIRAQAERDQEQIAYIEVLKADHGSRKAQKDAEIEKLRVSTSELRRLKEAQYMKEIAELEMEIEKANEQRQIVTTEAQESKDAQLQGAKKARYYHVLVQRSCTVL